MVYMLAWYVVCIGPYVLLAYGATLLWNRHSRWPAVLVAVGFSAAALSQMASAYVSTALSAALSSSDALATLMPRFRHWQWLTHDLGPLGIWLAAAGFLAHGLRQPPPDAG
jgi:hypothetical protein